MTLQSRAPENLRSCRWGAEQRVSRAQTWERRPPSALAEIGPSGLRALPLAAGINEGGHYFAYIFPLLIFFFLLPPLFKTTEGVVVGFQIFAWAPEILRKK